MAFTQYIGDTEAGDVMPVEYSNQVIKEIENYSAALKLGRRWDMGTREIVVPVVGSLPTTAAAVTQGSLIPVSNISLDDLVLVAAKFGTIVPIAREIYNDAQFSFEKIIVPLVGQDLGSKIDAAVFIGTGKPASWTQPAILTAAGTATSTVTKSADLLSDINDMMALVETDLYDVNGWVALNSLKSSFRGMRDINGNPIYNPVAQGFPATLYGESIEFSKNGSLSSACQMVCGDFSKLIMGVLQDFSMTVLTEATITNAGGDTISLAQNDMVGIKITGRFAYQVAAPATPAGAGAYPFSVLVA